MRVLYVCDVIIKTDDVITRAIKVSTNLAIRACWNSILCNLNDETAIMVKIRISAQSRVKGTLWTKVISSNQVLKCILSQSTDSLNNQIKYYLKIYTFDLSLNLPYISHNRAYLFNSGVSFTINVSVISMVTKTSTTVVSYFLFLTDTKK